MRVGIVKPDYGIVGGFELVLGRVEAGLQQRGHTVRWLTVDVSSRGRQPFGVDVPGEAWEAQPEFFRYLDLVDAFSTLPCQGVDVVMSTQPPSFAVDHPRQLALFSHHHRIYYDLSDVYVEGGFARDPGLHAAAERLIRKVDDVHLRRPRYVLATSQVVKDRLRRFTGLDDNVGIYHAGIGVPLDVAPEARRFDRPLCVSRHEFPKRTELFVHAMKFLPGIEGVAVGGGGRLPYVRAVDRRLTTLGSAAADVDARSLWVATHDGVPTEDGPDVESNVVFLGRVSDEDLGRLYAECLCVVAPAYLEDYGLTAIEAMQHGKPVIVCNDGGGLLAFVEDGVNGFVVEPEGAAIAAAVQRLHDDRGLAQRMGEAAAETAARFRWERTIGEIEAALELVASA